MFCVLIVGKSLIYFFCRLVGTKMKEIYHILDDGRIIEIRNWTGVESDDAILARPLTDIEKQKYFALKALSFSDREIFGQLNPEFAKQIINPEVKLPLDKLTREQIIWCINRSIGDHLNSLFKLSTKDLVKLFLKLNE